MSPFLPAITFLGSYHVGNPHYLRGRVLMIEVGAVFEVVLVLVKLDDLHLVLGILYKGAERETEVLLRPVAEVDRV